VSISRILDMLAGRTAEPQPRQQHDPLCLATAAVLLDIAYADGEFSPSEDGDVAGFLARKFALAPDDTRELMEAASEIRTKTIDHFALTHYIRKNAPMQDRLEIVRTMWRMAYGDGKLSDYEAHLVKKLGELLGIERHIIMDVKSDVLRELGQTAQ
jgi:uncharacterized tellurite resistance protein B-like protein